MSESRLVFMANQIATYFRTAPHDEAVASTLDSVKKFWEPRMAARSSSIWSTIRAKA